MSGQYIAYRYSMRVTLLEKALVMLSIIENDICFLKRPAINIIGELSKKNELKSLSFLNDCNILLHSGEEFGNAWITSLNKITCFQPFKKEDIEILKAFSINFGKTDTEGQISNCRIHRALLAENLNEAKAERQRYASVCTIFGIVCGVFVFIIFI